MITKLALEKCKVDKTQEIAMEGLFCALLHKDRIMLFCCFMHRFALPGQFVINSVNLYKK